MVKKRKVQEYLTLCALVPMLLFFSLSKFQLNFYTNILFPFFSILVASFIFSAFSPKEKKFYTIAQLLYSSVFVIGAVVINFLLRPSYQWMYFAGSALLIIAIAAIIVNDISTNLRWLVISCFAVLYINFYLNFTLYPMMSSLKGENQAGAYVNKFFPQRELGVFQNRRNGFEFYSHQPVQRIDLDQWMKGVGKNRIFYIDDILYSELVLKKASFSILKEFPDYGSESITGKFLNASTRNQSLQKGYLIQAIQ